MAVVVRVRDANVFYHPSNPGGTESKNHKFMSLPGQTHIPDATTPIPISTFTLSSKHNRIGISVEWLFLDDDAFRRFKNGGKRLPPKDDAKLVVHDGGVALSRKRKDRERDTVVEGDVGPYAAGPGNLKKAKLDVAINDKPISWSVGGAGAPAYFETDPSHPTALNRDHQNNQRSLSLRGDDPSRGVSIAIPQWVHMNGYTFGAKAKDSKKKGRNPDFPGQSRSEWISAHPSEALFKEIYQSIRAYADGRILTYEIVGSFRYMYKLAVGNGYQASSNLDDLIMHYLKLAH
jgi:hypothetical protein